MKGKIRTGLASYGMSGRVFHAPFLETNPGYILKTVLERTPKGSKEKYPGVNIVTSYEELLSDKNIDLIVVNTPDHTHYELVKNALNAGKHVVVEKPFVVESSDGEELIKIAKEENLVLSVFQNRRWDGDFLTVKKVVKDGLLGRLVEYEAHFDRYRNFIKENTWKEEEEKGTGVLYNLGSHLIDQALVLFGLPELVNANIRTFRAGGKVNDYFDIRLEYPNFRVILRSSYLVREPGPTYILNGINGSFVKYGTDPQEELLNKGVLPVGKKWVKEKEDFWGLLNTSINGKDIRERIITLPGNYNEFYNNVYKAIKEDVELAVKPGEALDVIRIIEMAIRSNREGRSVEF